MLWPGLIFIPQTELGTSNYKKWECGRIHPGERAVTTVSSSFQSVPEQAVFAMSGTFHSSVS